MSHRREQKEALRKEREERERQKREAQLRKRMVGYGLGGLLVAIVAVFIGEVWSRLAACVFLGVWLVVVALGYASFGMRLATTRAGAQPAMPTLAAVQALLKR